MTDKVETVKVKADTKSGFRIINKSDMKKDDVVYKEKAPKPEKAPEAEKAETPKKEAKKKASKKK